MFEFIRQALSTLFKLIGFLIVSALAAALVTGCLATAGNDGPMFLAAWIVIGLLLVAFPEIWKWLNSSL